MNAAILRHQTGRDPARLVDALRADVDLLLELTAGTAPDTTVTWLGGSRVSVAGLFAHLINELRVHGWDMARAAGEPWPIARADAALFVDLFLVGILERGHGHLFDTDRPARVPISVLLTSAWTRPVQLRVEGARVTAAEPAGDADIRIRFDPVVLDLMLFGRMSRARALLTGGVVVTGRRPWLMPEFLRVVRLPGR